MTGDKEMDRWYDIKNAPMDGTDILCSAKIDGRQSRPAILYYEHYRNLGWLCSRTNQPVSTQPEIWTPVPIPPAAQTGE
jgi:hypothetical protein